ncbi:MAG: methionyl-tRNA formyltransferase, partial [Pseudomonadota bacterium]|nr:methionyl-tRNA formyltransferase [Pseudomonadota bacterium]
QRHSSMPGQIVDTTAEHLFIACGEQSTLRVSRLQLPNKPQKPVAELINGYAQLLKPGQTFV